MFPVYNCNNVMMNITKYKLFPFLINGRGIIIRDQWYKNFEFLGIYLSNCFSQRWCVWPFLPAKFIVYQYGSILPSYPLQEMPQLKSSQIEGKSKIEQKLIKCYTWSLPQLHSPYSQEMQNGISPILHPAGWAESGKQVSVAPNTTLASLLLPSFHCTPNP